MQDTNNTQFYELNINQGDALLKLLPQTQVPSAAPLPAQAVFFQNLPGKVGIMRIPEAYQLDVHGLIRSYSTFADTDESSMSKEEYLDVYLANKKSGTALDKLKSLKPLAFEWDQSTGLQGEGIQFGLKAQEVQDIIPEAVKEGAPGQRLALSYDSIQALHIQATQALVEILENQQKMIDQLKAQIIALGGTI